MAHAGGLARLGIGHEALAGVAMLAVEDAGQRARGLGQRGMRGDVVHAIAPDPESAPRLAQAVQELLAGAGAHAGIVPSRRGHVKRPGTEIG